MAGGYGGQLIALDAETPEYNFLDAASNVEKYRALQNANALQQGAISELPYRREILGQQAREGSIRLGALPDQLRLTNEGLGLGNEAQRLGNVGVGQTNKERERAYRESVLQELFSKEYDDAESFDKAVDDAVAGGVPEAAQYKGRWTPLRQQRWKEGYAAQAGVRAGGGAGGGLGPATGGGGAGAFTGAGGQPGIADALERQIQGMSPADINLSMEKTQRALQSLSRVRDAKSWDSEVDELVQDGIPQAAQFKGAYNELDGPRMVQQMYQMLTQQYQALQQHAVRGATNFPQPQVPHNIQGFGSGIFDVDQYGGTVKQIGQVPQQENEQVIGYTDEGYPIIKDTRGGPVRVDKTAKVAVGRYAPQQRLTDYDKRLAAGEALYGKGSPQAMDIALGKKVMDPATARRAAISMAQRDVQTASFTTPIPDPEAYIRQKTEEYYRDIMDSQRPEAIGGGEGEPARAPADAKTAEQQKAWFDKLAPGSQFINPADGRILTKKK